jgi:ribosomal protein S12 methylthiotransferase accessory factor
VQRLTEFLNRLGFSISVKRVPFFNDEPKVFQYVAELVNTQNNETIVGYGSDFIKSQAMLKSMGEVIERKCLSVTEGLSIIWGSPNEIKDAYVCPRKFQSFSDAQLSSETFRAMRFSDSTELSWTLGENVLTGQRVWLPAQLVFCPYDVSAEPVIRFPSSNGAALGYSNVEASCKAVLEVIERDAFMCWYLAAMPVRLIGLEDLRENADFSNIYTTYQRYKLELQLLLLPSSWPFPVVLAAIIDHTGIGPGLTIGMKCHPQLITAVKGAVAEAQQMRPWLRDHIQLHGLPKSFVAQDIKDYWDRALFWARPEQYHLISAIWTSAEQINLEEFNEHTLTNEEIRWEELWNRIISIALKNKIDLFVTDLSGHIGKELGLNVAKALIPQAHPVYMDERFPYLNSVNLKSAVDAYGYRWNVEASTIPPHPFS